MWGVGGGRSNHVPLGVRQSSLGRVTLACCYAEQKMPENPRLGNS